MNILDTFFFMFQADASGVEKGMKSGDDAAKKLDKTVTETDKSVVKLNENFIKMAKSTSAALAGIFALAALKTLVTDTANHTAALALQARSLNMATEQLGAYQNAVRGVGGTVEEATATLAGLRDKFVEMSRFGVMVGPDAFMFRQLGLSAQEMKDSIKDPTVALGALAEKFQQLDKTQQLYIGKKLGLDQGTIALLGEGKQAFTDMIAKQKELGVVTQEQADASLKYNIAQQSLGITMATIKREIVTAFLPAIRWVVQHLDSFLQWVRQHKELVIGFFITLAGIITVALLPALISSAVAMWAMIAPVLLAAAPFIALAAAVGLVVDDIVKYIDGQDSLIDSIENDLLPAGSAAKEIFDKIKAAIKGAWEELKGFKDLLDKPITDDDILDVFGKIGKKVEDIFTSGNDIPITNAPKVATPPASTAKALGNSANGAQIAAKLVAMGWSSEQAAGIAGSFMQESGGKADAVNPISGAYGIAQWLGSRRKDFEKWAGHKIEGTSLDEQLQFFQYETKNKEKRAGDMLRSAKTAAEAASIHSKYYERPGAAEANNARREMMANDIYAGKNYLATTRTPLATQSTTSIANASRNKSTTVQTGDITINTQATDSKAIAESLTDHIKSHFNEALDYHDDGVMG